MIRNDEETVASLTLQKKFCFSLPTPVSKFVILELSEICHIVGYLFMVCIDLTLPFSLPASGWIT